MTNVLQDLRYGVKGLLKQPSFTAAAVLALALGIGATTTIFSVIQNVLLDPYPMYTDVDRIINLRIQDLTTSRPGGRGGFSVPEFLDYQAQATVFDDVIGGTGDAALYAGPEGTEQWNGGLTTGNTFAFMGIGAAVGRTITMDDVKPGAPPVFVMSHKLWTSRFAFDRSIVGRSFTVNGVPRTLVGIMPPRVSKLAADVWIPVRLDPTDPALRRRFFMFQARLKPGVTIAQAEAEMNVIARRLAQVYPKDYPTRFNAQVVGIVDAIVGRFRSTLFTMAAAVGLLLLIACANVANLLLSRAAAREREMAIRGSLGASRVRLVRQLLVESLVLALVSLVVGCGFAYFGTKLVAGAIPEGLIPRESLIQLDPTVLTFSLAVAALTALLFGLAPALQTARRDLLTPLRDSGKGTSGGFRGRRLSSGLVVAEIALSLVLLNSAGLLMRSFIKLQTVSLGLNPENVLFVAAPVAAANHRTVAAQQQFLSQVLARVRAVPGVVSAATTSGFPPFGGPRSEFDIPGIAHGDRWRALVDLCGEDYLRTLGVPIVKGRDFTPDDTAANRKVAMVNQALVERHLAGVDPLGRQIAVDLMNGEGALQRQSFEIVGVVADAKNQGIREPVDPQIFLPYAAAPMPFRGLLVKTAVVPGVLLPTVKSAIWAVDRGVPLAEAGAVTEYLTRFGYSEPRLGLFVFGSFAVIALVLVLLGVYSLVAYSVARRTHEIGIRMAVGATRGDVLQMTVGIGIRWIVAGVIIGLLASVAAMRLLGGQLWQVSPTDPLTLFVVVAIIAAAALLASYVPALRATRVDPMVVLRCE